MAASDESVPSPSSLDSKIHDFDVSKLIGIDADSESKSNSNSNTNNSPYRNDIALENRLDLEEEGFSNDDDGVIIRSNNYS